MNARPLAPSFVLGSILFALTVSPAEAAPKAAEPPTVPSVSAAVARVQCQGRNPCAFGSGVGAVFEGLRWGMTRKQIAELYNKPGGLIDQEFNPELRSLQPGRQMAAKEAERDDKKRAFEASFVQFQTTPTGYDASPIRAEYTYRNNEAVMSTEKDTTRRYLFFIGAPPAERLWKVYQEVRLVNDGPLGSTYEEAVTSISGYLATAGRVLAVDSAKGILSTTVAWQDEKSQLRVIDRSREGLVGIVLEDRQVLSALPQLRVNRLEDPFALDPAVRAITQQPISDPSAERPAPPAEKPAPAAKKGRR